MVIGLGTHSYMLVSRVTSDEFMISAFINLNDIGFHNVSTHWMYLSIVRIGLRMGSLMKPKHVAQTMYYWLYIDVLWLNKTLYEFRIVFVA